ncbi:hypothetical protein QOZ95_002054 [Paenibacillus brasilensis]|uniref:Uncharacterized protein n=1 Tax=Paenibacillus brasilensis TaxID=128574 RepID=A0ABU0KWR8_9BACL|nr:hypothetical protein [Paenibacillus brasilensis]
MKERTFHFCPSHMQTSRDFRVVTAVGSGAEDLKLEKR